MTEQKPRPRWVVAALSAVGALALVLGGVTFAHAISLRSAPAERVDIAPIIGAQSPSPAPPTPTASTIPAATPPAGEAVPPAAPPAPPVDVPAPPAPAPAPVQVEPVGPSQVDDDSYDDDYDDDGGDDDWDDDGDD